MKIEHSHLIKLLALLLLLAPLTAFGEKSNSLGELINVAGMQRMLSQKIAKSYFFLGQGVRQDKARQQMNEGLDQFRLNHSVLKSRVKRIEVQELLTFVDLAYQEYVELCKQPYNQENGALVLDLSETLLEVSQNIVQQLERTAKTSSSKVVNIAGRQRMLSQRIAKYYSAYQMGFRDDNSVIQLNKAVHEFETALVMLSTTKSNSKPIGGELRSINSLWKVVRGFFVDVKKGGLPVTVFATTDAILKRTDKVTKMYVAVGSESYKDGESRVASE